MTCDECRQALECDARPAAEERTVRTHLAGCSECAEYAENMSAHAALVRRAVMPTADEARFARLKHGVNQRIDEARAVRLPQTGGRNWRIVALAGGMAAMLLISAGVYWHMRGAAPNAAPGAGRLSARSNVLSQVADLQSKIRSSQVLGELVQLQAAMDAPDDQDGKSAAEDAELYVERILALHDSNEQAYRETLLGIGRSGVSARLRKLRDSLAADAPRPVFASLELAIAMFDQAGKIVQVKEVAYAD